MNLSGICGRVQVTTLLARARLVQEVAKDRNGGAGIGKKLHNIFASGNGWNALKGGWWIV